MFRFIKPALLGALMYMCSTNASSIPSIDAPSDTPTMRFSEYDEAINPLFVNNRRWVKRRLARDPEYFKKQEKGQSPSYLFIGCSDSRVPAQDILGLKAGEVFVHRNVANLVVNTDLNLLSVIQYAIEVLKIKDVIICGHYGCGGVKAALENQSHGLIDHWLRNIRDVHRLHAAELREIADKTQRHRRLIEFNVKEQCVNLAANTIIQNSIKETGYPRIHGLVYDLSTGYLKKLDIDFKREVKSHKDIYMVHDGNPIFH